MKRVILGAGGHAKVVYDACVSSEKDVHFLADIKTSEGFNKVPVIMETELRPESHILVLGIGDNANRKNVYEKYHSAGFKFETIIHPSAVISVNSKIGSGSVVLAGAVINHSAEIMEAAIINTSAVVEHDCLVEDFAHISPSATLCGGVRIGTGAWIGANSTIIEYKSIGSNAVIGAGSVVNKDVKDNIRGAGVPFKEFQ